MPQHDNDTAMKADIYRCSWDSGWMQFHDDDDPMPDQWDDDAPTTIDGFVSQAKADALLAALQELAGWQTTAPPRVLEAAHAAIELALGHNAKVSGGGAFPPSA